MSEVAVSCIVTSHNNLEGLKHILNNLRLQCFPSYEVIILASDTDKIQLAKLVVESKDFFDKISVYHEENKNDWGHDKRAKGLSLAKGEYVGFFNDDDEYSNDYLKKMCEAIVEHGADLVYCNFHSHITGGVIDSYLGIGAVTSGNFLVRTKLAQDVGYNDRSYSADGVFIMALKEQGAKAYKLNECLYTHK